MKLFQTVQKLYEKMGIYHPIQHNKSFNKRNLIFLLAMFLFFVSATGALLFQELSIIQRAQTFVVSISEITCMVNVLTCIWKRAKIFNLIEKLEIFIEKSKPYTGE